MSPSLSRSLICLATISATGAAVAEAGRPFDVRAGRLDHALVELARQGGIDLGGTDLALPTTTVRGLRGRMAPPRALSRLLSGTGLSAIQVGPNAFRLVRSPPPVRRRIPTMPVPARPAPGQAAGDIVVTAGKRDALLSRFVGSAVVIALDGNDAAGPLGTEATAWLVRQTPILQQTELGAGRNKLFIRGIADSSFTGPTQSTAATYFADVRMGYNGPDPNLALLDMRRAEVLEGPQGTLYGAGSIGGVIRLTPRTPVLDDRSMTVEGGVTATQRGGLGHDMSGVINLPLVRDSAIRLLGYRQVEGGYVDDVGLTQDRHANRAKTQGGRAAFRLEPAAGWRLDLGAIVQSIASRDLQYGQRGLPALRRASALAQPFEDDYLLARGTLAKTWSNGVAATYSFGRVWHDTSQRYDATRLTSIGPIAYDEDGRIRMTSQELRLSWNGAGGASGVLGASRIDDTTSKARRIGTLTAPRDIVGVTNRTREKALFGEATLPLFDALNLTGGLRWTRARMDGEPDTRVSQAIIRGQTSQRIDPSGGVNWQVTPRVNAYVRYSQGFRTAGLAVARGIGRVANYRSDTIRVGEVGIRLSRHGAYGLSGSAAVSYAGWEDIQADLVDRFGFPYTGNLGNGRIAAFELLGNWLGRGGWHVNAGALVTRSKLIDAEPEFVAARNQPLPDTPRLTLTLAGGWKHSFARDRALSLDASLRYVGHSSLGLGTVLGIAQGDYTETRVAARYAAGRYGLFAELANLLDETSNRFAIGNPFGVAARDQYTPQRPRNLRIGVSVGL